MRTIIKIKRSDNPSPYYILENGELFFNSTKKCFYIGDGKTKLIHLKEYTNFVEGKDGKMYGVTVDENGKADAKSCSLCTNNIYDLYVK